SLKRSTERGVFISCTRPSLRPHFLHSRDIKISPGLILMQETAGELGWGEFGTAHEVHQVSFAGPHPLCCSLQTFQGVLRDFQYSVFITVQQVTWPNFQAQNVNWFSHMHDLEIRMTHNFAPGEVVEAQGPNLRHIAHSAIAHQTHGSERSESRGH